MQQVAITSFEEKTLSFQTRTQTNALGDFTASTDQILASPPTGAPTPVAWMAGAVGNLYLSRAGWQNAETNPKGGLYGYNVPGAILFKYPTCAPFRGIEPLDIVPTMIQITGDDGRVYDMLGPDVAPAQQVTWNAAGKIGIALKTGEVKQIWPTKIAISGSPKAFPNIKAGGPVDILDVEHADFLQSLSWQSPRDPVTLRLNERGFEMFKIVQSAIHQFAAGASVTYPGALVDDLNGRGQALDPLHAKALDDARTRLAGMKLSDAQRTYGKRPS
ncbi:MAG TPA: hypothetical protein VH143_10095 [Kofleriaceae bacterium]|nr:hypothetical protein [Kofleriaceae bacterium]